MARRTFHSRITTPNNTTRASPQTTAVALPQGTLVRVEVVVPSGHAGLTGLALRYANEHVWPWGPDTWIEADDEVLRATLDFPLGGSAIDVLTYNTDDTFNHDHLLRLTVLDPVVPAAEPIGFLPLAPSTLGVPAEGSVEEDVALVGDVLVDDAEDGVEVVAE